MCRGRDRSRYPLTVKASTFKPQARPRSGASCFDDHPQYPVEVLNCAALVFGVGGYMLGECLLLRLGLIISLVDNEAMCRGRDRSRYPLTVKASTFKPQARPRSGASCF